MLFPMKHNQTRDLNVDIGQGDDVGITYTSSNPTLASVSSTGVVTILQDVLTLTAIFITAKDANGINRKVFHIDVVPSSLNLGGYVNAIKDTPKEEIVTVGKPLDLVAQNINATRPFGNKTYFVWDYANLPNLTKPLPSGNMPAQVTFIVYPNSIVDPYATGTVYKDNLPSNNPLSVQRVTRGANLVASGNDTTAFTYITDDTPKKLVAITSRYFNDPVTGDASYEIGYVIGVSADVV